MSTRSDVRARLLRRLGAGEILLFDGGMGTEIYNRGVFINVCYDEVNLTRPDLVRAIHADYVAAGADLLETNTYGATAEPDAFIVAQTTVREDGTTVSGVGPERFVPALREAGADVAGLNCSLGPAAMFPMVARMRAAGAGFLSVQPNAGVPRTVEGRNLYLCSPEYLAEYARRFVQSGANVLGGCCGTNPSHVRAMRAAVRSMAADHGLPRVIGPADAAVERDAAEVAPSLAPPLAERSRLGAALAAGAFPVSVELTPPRGPLLGKLIEKARRLKDLGVTCVNLPDGPRATARMSALATGVRMQAEVGVEALLHYTCRDRNLLGIQSDLLGAWALGIKNLLIITGDPPKMGTYPDATAVFDVDAIGLTHLVRRLNSALDLGGSAIGAPTGFVFGVGVNPGALNQDVEVDRFRRKLEAGAEFAITQPVFDVGALEAFAERLDREGLLRVPILAGVWPLTSLAAAQFLNSEVPGITVPEPVLARMAAAADREGALATGVQVAREMIAAVRGIVQGLQVSAPLGRVDLVAKVLEPGTDTD